MSDELLVRHCAPTLAGLKTANMFNCEYDSRQEMREDLRKLNRRLNRKGIMAVPLRYSGKTALIYIVRLSKLKGDLDNELAHELLEAFGYADKMPGSMIAELSRRLSEEDFPHEIGLFLGYPPEDVEGFISKGNCKLTGYWKVYGDEDKARRTFEKYNKCYRVYLSQLEKGSAVEKLAVGI